MQTLPQIFNSRAEFVEPASLDGLDAETVARLDGVRIAAAALRTAQDAERNAVQEIADCLQVSQDARDYRLKHFPPSSPHDEWVRNFGNPEQQRALAQREAERHG